MNLPRLSCRTSKKVVTLDFMQFLRAWLIYLPDGRLIRTSLGKVTDPWYNNKTKKVVLPTNLHWYKWS